MSTGLVTAFLADRGFGFIRPDGNKGVDLFVHIRDVANRDSLKGGDRVEFEVIEDERRGKPRASRVRVL